MTQSITYGTSYYPDHWPEKDWERDLQLIKNSGIDVVRFGEFSWSWFVPRAGVYDFTSYDHFMNLALRSDLKVMLCTPTCNAPQWFFAQYPDTRQLDQYNRPHIGHRHMACYNHPAALNAAQEVVIKLAEHYRDHPALAAWQIDNELTAGESTDLHKLYDYHPYTVACYREHLKKQYESLDDLNAAWWNNFWGNRYSDWNEIDPPRPGLSGNISPAKWLEWSRFRTMNIAEFGRKQAGWLREIKSDFYIGTNVPEVSPLKGSLLGQDYWELCKEMDFIGTDIYAYSGNKNCDQQRIAYSCDVIRSAAAASKASFGVLETQAGPHKRPWRMDFAGGDWGPEFLENSVYTLVTHGAKYVYFFLWRPTRGGAEFGMNGLVNTDGSPTERSLALPHIFKKAEMATDLLANRPVAYIHYSNDTLHLLSINDPDNSGDEALPGWHTLLEDMGWRVVFLNDEALANIEDCPPGPVILAQSMVLSQVLCDRLVETTHPVVGVGALGYFDENACMYPTMPGGSLAKRFGIKIESFEANRSVAQDRPWIDEFPLMHARIKATTGKLIFFDDSKAVGVAYSPNSLYFNFDVGTLYKRLQFLERAHFRQDIMPHIRAICSVDTLPS